MLLEVSAIYTHYFSFISDARALKNLEHQATLTIQKGILLGHCLAATDIQQYYIWNVVTRNCPELSALSKLSGDSCEWLCTRGLSAVSKPGCLITTSGMVYTGRTCAFTQKENTRRCISTQKEKQNILDMHQTYQSNIPWKLYVCKIQANAKMLIKL
jgi:hypothetical protein